MQASNEAEPQSRSGAAELATFLAAALLAGLCLHAYFTGREQVVWEDLALAKTTARVYASVDGSPIHCRTVVDADRCLDAFTERGGTRAALWLGNSQLHSINHWQPEEQTAPLRLHLRLRSSGIDLVTFSQPNANLQEHLALWLYLSTRLPVEALILPLVFDDMRESGIRGDIEPALEDPPVVEALERHEIGHRILSASRREGALNVASASDETTQDRTEAAIEGWLSARWPLWKMRADARGKLFKDIHDIRDLVLGIKATSKRRLIPVRYAMNLQALEVLVEEAERAGARVFVYIVPLRSDVERPYVAEEYAAFKETAQRFARERALPFMDLESTVATEHWGNIARDDLTDVMELDFMHFRSGGHDAIADALGNWIEAELAIGSP